MSSSTAYVRPKNLADCIEALSKATGSSAILAGGTDVVVRIKKLHHHYDLLVDLGGIDELRSIQTIDGRLRIGATTTMSELARNPMVLNSASCLAQAARVVGSKQIRSMATLGGNVANASPVADTVPALHVHKAEVVIVGPTGERRVPIAEFATGPGNTVLEATEIICAIELGPVEANETGFYHRTAQRRMLSIAKTSLAGRIVVNAGIVTSLHLAAGAVGPTVIGTPKAAASLIDAPLTYEYIDRAAAILESETTPIDDHRSTKEYRASVTGALLKKALYPLVTSPSTTGH